MMTNQKEPKLLFFIVFIKWQVCVDKLHYGDSILNKIIHSISNQHEYSERFVLI